MLTGVAILTMAGPASATSQSIEIESGSIRIELASPDAGMGLMSIRHREQGAEFLKPPSSPQAALLWKIELTANRKDPDAFVTVSNTDASVANTIRRDGDDLVLQWRGLSLPGEAGVLDVTVTCEPQDEAGFSRWRIAVENRSDRHGIWRVIFPIMELGVIGDGGMDDYVIMSPAEGRSVRNPIGVDAGEKGERVRTYLSTDTVEVTLPENLSADYGFGAAQPHGLPYPTARGQMQLSAYYEKAGDFYYPALDPGPALYFSPHDGKGYPKIFFYTPSAADGTLTYEMANFPDEAAKPGLDYAMPYPMVIGGFEGDWYDAAAIYRQFAVKQKWTEQGTLSERDDLPAWLTDITLVTRADVKRRTNDDAMPMFQNIWEQFHTTVGVQWYNWSAIEKDPNTGGFAFPPRPEAPAGFGEIVEHIQQRDMHVFPYLNTRLWDTTTPGYDQVKPYIIQLPNGKPSIANWPDRQAARMCLQTDFWQTYLVDTARAVVQAYGVNGLYLDQAGAAQFGGTYEGNGCFDPSHGHPLGITRDLVRAEHERMRAVLEAGRSVNPDLVLTGEGGAENFIDVFANRLIHFEIWPGYVPLFAAVYHDYTTSYGRTVKLSGRDEDDPIPAMQIGWQLVLGNQLGRLWITQMRDSQLERPVVQKHLDYLKRAVELREQASDFLTLGQMLRPPYLLSETPWVVTHEFRRDRDCSLPGVLASTWRAPDGRVATVVTNITHRALETTIALDRSIAGASHGRQRFPKAAKLPLDAVEGNDHLASVSMTLDPYAIRLIEWTQPPADAAP